MTAVFRPFCPDIGALLGCNESADTSLGDCEHIWVTGFWSGVVAALIGAVVGGSFTAVAAAMQVRGTAEAASRQLREAFAHERQVRDEQYYRSAVTETTVAMSDFADAMDALAHDHKTCRIDGSECKRLTLSKQVHDAATAVSRCGNLYWFLWADSESIQLAFELATGLLYYEIDDPQSLTLSDLVKESPEVSDRAQREAYCSYGLLGFHSGGSIATSALNELREKAWSGIRLPSRRRNRYNEHVADDLREV